MIVLNDYLEKLLSECRSVFGDRLLYLGLQGSYLRGEATDHSDIDVMVLIDRLSVADMDAYRRILKSIGHFELSCGFLCGREEMARWNPLELCQLRYTTKGIFGNLSDYLPEANRTDEINYCKLSLGNLYHVLCHGYVHAQPPKGAAWLRRRSKDLFFLIQNMQYLETGVFAPTKRDLCACLSAEDRAVLDLADLSDDCDFTQVFTSLFLWCQNAFLRLAAIR